MSKFTDAAKHLDRFVATHNALNYVAEVLHSVGDLEAQAEDATKMKAQYAKEVADNKELLVKSEVDIAAATAKLEDIKKRAFETAKASNDEAAVKAQAARDEAKVILSVATDKAKVMVEVAQKKTDEAVLKAVDAEDRAAKAEGRYQDMIYKVEQLKARLG